MYQDPTQLAAFLSIIAEASRARGASTQLASFVHEEEEEEHPIEAMQTDRRAWDFDVDSDRRFIEPLVLALSADSENGEYDEQLEQLKAMSQKAKLQLAASKVLGKRNSPAA